MEYYSILFLPEICELILQHYDKKERLEAALVCREFYYTIRRLKQNQTLKLDAKKVMDDKIFGSMISSIRKFEKIEVTIMNSMDEAAAERTIAIAEKLKGNIKSLVVSTSGPTFPIWLQEISSILLNTLEEVEELTLPELPYKLAYKREFSNLRKLSVYADRNAAEIFKFVPDNSLESLTIKRPKDPLSLSQRRLQTFVNRQRKLKKLDIGNRSLTLNIDHLALEDLSMFMEADSDQMRLRNQTELRRLSCEMIRTVAFAEMCKMPKLEFLCAAFFQEVTGELSHMKELDLSGQISILRHVRLPKLEKLIVAMSLRLQPADIVALGRGSPSLQHIEIQNPQKHILPFILGMCPVLKTLCLHYPLASDNGSRSSWVVKNQNLEELIFWNPPYLRQVSSALVVDVINACPNVKRIQLHRFLLKDTEVLEIVQNNPQLTHLWLGHTNVKEVGSLNPAFRKIIDIFQDSPKFVSLSFWDSDDRRFRENISQDADQIIVTKSSDKTAYRQFTTFTKKSRFIKFSKKSNFLDISDDFDKRAEFQMKGV